jgi:hypothetical protein
MMKKFDANGDGILDENEKKAMKQFREQRMQQRGGGPGAQPPQQ